MLLMAAGNGGQGGRGGQGQNGGGQSDYGRSEYGGGRMEGGYGRSEYDGGGQMGYGRSEYGGPDSRFRDRRGREHYDNGRFAPRNDGTGMWMEGRYQDGQDPYSGMESHYPMPTPYAPPVYERYPSREGRPMNKIGFSVDGEMDRIPPEFGREYRSDAGHRQQMDEMAFRKGGERMSGYGSGTAVPPMTRETAMEWTREMQNADGSRGPHWTMEKTEEARNQRGIQCDPVKFYVAMNMMYSDYVKAAEKVNCSSMDFYAYMAKAFLDDKDAQPDKLERYYRYIVER